MQDKAIRLILDIKSQLPEASNKEIARVIAPDLGINDDEGIESLATEIDGIDVEANKKKELSDPNQVQTEESKRLVISDDVINSSLNGIVSSADSEEGARSALRELESKFGFALGQETEAAITGLIKDKKINQEKAKRKRREAAAFARSQKEFEEIAQGVDDYEAESLRDIYERSSNIRNKYPNDIELQLTEMVGAGLVEKERAARTTLEQNRLSNAVEAIESEISGMATEGRFEDAIKVADKVLEIKGISRRSAQDIHRQLRSAVLETEIGNEITMAYGAIDPTQAQALSARLSEAYGQEVRAEDIQESARKFSLTLVPRLTERVEIASLLPSVPLPSEEIEINLRRITKESEVRYEQAQANVEELYSSAPSVVGPDGEIVYMGLGDEGSVLTREDKAKQEFEEAKQRLALHQVYKEKMASFNSNPENGLAISALNTYNSIVPIFLAEKSGNLAEAMKSGDPASYYFRQSEEYQGLSDKNPEGVEYIGAYNSWLQGELTKNREEIALRVVEVLSGPETIGGKPRITVDQLNNIENKLKTLGVYINLTPGTDSTTGTNFITFPSFNDVALPEALVGVVDASEATLNFIARLYATAGAGFADLIPTLGNYVSDTFSGGATVEEYAQRATDESFTDQVAGLFATYKEDGFAEGAINAAKSIPQFGAAGLASYVGGPNAGFAVMSVLEAASYNESQRNNPEFASLSRPERFLATASVGVVAGTLERYFGDLALMDSFVKGGLRRMIMESRTEFGARIASRIGLGYVAPEVATEIATMFHQQLTTAYTTGDYSFFYNTNAVLDETQKTAISSGIFGGTVAGISVAKGSPDYRMLSVDASRELNLILEKTQEGSRERNDAIDQFFEKLRGNMAVLSASQDLLDYIGAVNHRDLGEINKIQNQIAILEQRVRAGSTSKEIIEELEAAHTSLENIQSKYRLPHQLTLGEGGIDTAIAANERLINRAKDRRRRAENAFGGLNDPSNAARFEEANREIERLSAKQQELAARKSELNQSGRPRRVGPLGVGGRVEVSNLEETKSLGYRVVSYDENGDAFMVYDPRGRVKINRELPVGLRNRDAALQAEVVSMRQNGASKSAIDSFLESSVIESLRRKENLTPAQELFYNKNKSGIDEAMASPLRSGDVDLDTRLAEATPSVDVTDSVSGSMTDIFGARAVSMLQNLSDKLNVRIVLADDEYSLSRSLIEAGEKSALGKLLDGAMPKGAYFNKTVYLSKNASFKDVIEEVLHAHFASLGTGAKARLIRACHAILAKDEVLARLMQDKKDVYERVGIRGLPVEEEQLAEALSMVLSKNVKLPGGPKEKLAELMEPIFEAIKKALSVFGVKTEEFSEVSKYRLIKMFSDSLVANKGLSVNQIQEKLDIEDSQEENAETQSPDEALFSFRGEKSFLYNKTVEYQETFENKQGVTTKVKNHKKTFNDYAHFRNWYNYMTNNGRDKMVSEFYYIDDQGNKKELRPPAPEVNKQTGEILGREKYNRPISYEAKELDRRFKDQKNKDQLRSNWIVVSNGIKEFISAKYGASGSATALRSYGLENADANGYVSTPSGRVLEGSIEHIQYAYSLLDEYIQERDGMGAETAMFSLDVGPARSQADFRMKFSLLADRIDSSPKSEREFHQKDMYALLRSIGVPEENAKRYAFEGDRTGAMVDSIYAQNVLHAAGRLTPLLTMTDRASRIISERAVDSVMSAFDEKIKGGTLRSMSFFEETNSAIVEFLRDSDPSDFGGQKGLDWANNNINLFKCIIAITSNGNTSFNNIALAKYVMMSLARNMAQDGSIDVKKKTIRGLMNKVENANAFKKVGVNPHRAKSIGKQLKKFINNIQGNDVGGSYDAFLMDLANKPGLETRWANSALMEFLSQKVGAWASNLIGNENVLTQDAHLVQVINVFRGSKMKRIPWKQLEKILGKENYKALETPKARIAFISDLIVRSCYENHKGMDLGFNDKQIKEISKWFNKNKKDILPTKPRGNEERSFNSKVVTRMAQEMSKLYGTNVTVATAQQMLFHLNHDQRSVAGVSGSQYQTYRDAMVAATTERASGIFDAELSERASDGLVMLMEGTELDRVYEGQAMYSLVPGESRTHGLDSFIGPNGDLLDQDNLTDVVSAYPLHSALLAQGSEPKEGQRVFAYVDPRIMSETLFPVINVSKTLSGQPMHVTSETVLTDVKFPRPSAFSMAGIATNNEGPKRHVSGKFRRPQEGDDLMTGVLIEMDPLRNNGFADENGRLIKSADEVTFIGGKMIARGNIQYYPESMNKNGLSAAETTASAATRTQAQNEPENQRAIMVNPAKKKGRLRGTAERASVSEDFYEIKNDILDNPNNYLDTQHLGAAKEELRGKSIQELVSMMRGDKLGSLMNRNDDLGVLAAIEIINRLQTEGRTEAIPGVLEDLAKMGTSVGRLLRQFAELKTSTSFGIYSMIAKLSESQGKVLSESQKNDLQLAADSFMDSYREYQALLDRAIAGEDVEVELNEAMKRHMEAQAKLDTLTNVFVDKTWSDIGIQLMQGNLLTSMSQAKNIAYNIAQMFPRTMVDLTSYPIEKLLGLMGMKTSGRRVSMAAYLHGIKKFGSGWVEAVEQVATGRSKEVAEWRMDRGFMPVRSLIAALSNDIPQTKNGRQRLNSRAKLLVAGTFGIPAETMFRFLSLGDIPFRRFAEATELYHIGVGKGLKGTELARFLKYPNREAMDKAADEGARMTFQKEGGLARGSMWIISNISRGLGKMFENNKGFDAPGFFRFFIRSNVPYVTTIANFMEESLTYISPAFGTARVASNILNNNAEEASKNATKVMVGQVFTQGALYMIAGGVLSGAVDWEDDEKTNIMYDVLPPNSINISALKRLMNGEDPTPQEGDVYKSYQTFGVLGSIMGAYAQSMTKEAAQDAINNPTKGINVLKRFLGMENASLISYMMDQSFMQGLNGMLEVITESDPEKLEIAMERYAESLSKAYTAMAIPNFFSGANMATREFLPDKRDESLMNRIFNHVKERTFNTDGLPVKVNWKGERIDQAPKGGNQFAYYMFDPYKTTTTGSDPVSIEILGIYTRTGELPKAVGTPYYASSVHRKLEVPSFKEKKARVALDKLRDRGKSYSFIGKTGEEFRFSLTAEELNDMLEMSNSHRYVHIQEFMRRPEYQNMSDAEKIDALNEINGKYNSMIEYYPDGTFMPHSVYLLDLIEKRHQSLQP